MWDSSLRLYRVEMQVLHDGWVLADDEDQALQKAVANQWLIPPAELPDPSTFKVTEKERKPRDVRV